MYHVLNNSKQDICNVFYQFWTSYVMCVLMLKLTCTKKRWYLLVSMELK